MAYSECIPEKLTAKDLEEAEFSRKLPPDEPDPEPVQTEPEAKEPETSES